MKSTLRRILGISLVLTFAIIFNPALLNAQGSYSMKTQANTKMTVKGKTVVKVVNSDNDTSIFAVLLKKSGFAQILNKKGPFTVLAPNNEALKSSVQVSKLEKSPKKLKKVVQDHLYKGKLPEKKVESALGVKVIDSHTASNGVVYVINSVVKQ